MTSNLGGAMMKKFQAAAEKLNQPSFKKKMRSSLIGFTFEGIETECATRFKFDVKKNDFVQDPVNVVMQNETMVTELPGATRVLYRCKVVSKLRGGDCYVAKAYRDSVANVGREIYFIDCKMQILAKAMAEEFNRLKPPHRIDFLECFILELRDRPGKPLLAAEKFIEGHYEKHSSNNGFVEESHYRLTPHAFSHFTFVMSNGKRMIVDLQGVGDLWTDPQVHCTTNEDFGIGNTGLLGIAKFFRTYRYNPLCEWLGLHPFKQSPYDVQAHDSMEWEKLTHNWTLSDLAKKPNPNREAIRKRSAKLGGNVHFQMAKMYESGSFAPDVEPCLKSAVFHCEVSAELGFAPANICLAQCYSGIPRDVLREHGPREDHSRAFKHWLVAAKDGNPTAMYFVAQYYEGALVSPEVAVSWVESSRWYKRLIRAHHLIEEEGLGEEEEDQAFEMHRILCKVADMYAEGGNGLGAKPGMAAQYYNEAAEEAESVGKSKMAAKYYEKAAQYEGGEEEGEEEEEDAETFAAMPSPASSRGEAGSLSDFMESFSLDGGSSGNATPKSPGRSVATSLYFVQGDLPTRKDRDAAEQAKIKGVHDFINIFSSSFKGGGEDVTTVPLGKEEMARMSSFIKAYKGVEAKLESGSLMSDEGPSAIVTCRWSSPPSGDLVDQHVLYIRGLGAQVSVSGRFGSASGGAGGVTMLLNATKEEAESIAKNDPLTRVDAYEATEVYEWVTHFSGMASVISAEAAMQAAASMH